MKISKILTKLTVNALFLSVIISFAQKAEAMNIKLIDRVTNSSKTENIDESQIREGYTMGEFVRYIGSLYSGVNSIKFNRKVYSYDSTELFKVVFDKNRGEASVFVCPQNVETPELPPARPVPAPIRGAMSLEDIRIRTKQLMDLGFKLEDVEKALRAAQFNTDRAVDYLLSGNIPEPLVIGIIR